MYIKAHNIKYDTTDAAFKADLPKQLIFQIDEEVDQHYLDNELADHVADHVGVCVESLEYETLEQEPDDDEIEGEIEIEN